MLQLHPVTLEDRQWIVSVAAAENSRNADHVFGNLYMWAERYAYRICRLGDRQIAAFRSKGAPAFEFPIGAGELADAVLEMKAYAQAQNVCLRIFGVEQTQKEALEALFPGKFDFRRLRIADDYLYRAEELARYPGARYQKKKNFCNRFERENPDWSFEPLTAAQLPACLQMLERWMAENADRLEDGVRDEYDALRRGFAAFDRLGLEGGVLRSGGRVLGFSAGEPCGSDCFVVHFEKADAAVPGAYAVICREMSAMALRHHPGLVYINREDDMGIDGLRRSKLSYHPAFLLEKYLAVWKEP